ncbi:MAG: insulinase family protein [Nitrospirae bacterium]|nr:insulinase family protein [Nitrospirota bacterium]
MKKFLLIILLLLSLTGCAHTAKDITPVTESNVYEEILPNGLKVLLLKDPDAPLAVFQIWYNAGAINDQTGKTGLSHLLEHMMFKGTPKYGPKTFSQIISRVGGVDNAATSEDYAMYFQKLAPDRLNLSIELEADRMRNLIIDPKEALSERDVVMEERRMRTDDDPQSVVYEEVVSTAFKNHPYRRPVVGWMSDLEKITSEDISKYYETYYAPNNAFIVVAGNIQTDSILKKIRNEFGPIPKGQEIMPVSLGEPQQMGERRVYVKKEAELPYILIGYKAPNILDEESYALDVLAFILSDGKSSRIYKSLVDEKQVALSAGASYSNFQKYPFLFFLSGTAAPGKGIDEVEKGLYEEVEKIKNAPPSEKEVQKVKNIVEAEFIMDQDSISSQARLMGLGEIIGDWRLKDRYVEGIRRVTPDDVQRVARKYMIEDKRNVGILIPLKKNK